MFNDGGILEKVKNGQATMRVVKDAHPSPPLADEPECTKSQLLAYYDLTGQKLAEAHQYVRPDGTIGASGKPDPKEVLHEGIVHLLDRP